MCLVIRAALDDVGLAYTGDDKAAAYLASGALVRVLEECCHRFPGFFLVPKPATTTGGTFGVRQRPPLGCIV
jgi:hypothetical protein